MDDPLTLSARFIIIEMIIKLKVSILNQVKIDREKRKKICEIITELSNGILPNDLTPDEIKILKEAREKLYD